MGQALRSAHASAKLAWARLEGRGRRFREGRRLPRRGNEL